VTTHVDSRTRRTRQRLRPAGGSARPPTLGPEPLFRFPTPDDPDPGTTRVLAMSLYAAALGLAGVGVGLRGLVSVLGGVPGWYVPLLVLMGLVSVVLAIGAFLSLHRPALPWTLLLAAAVPLAGDIALAVAY
jgi:hypothetical protein